MSDVTLYDLFEEKGITFNNGGGDTESDVCIEFKYSDHDQDPGVVAVAKLWVDDPAFMDELFDEGAQFLGEHFDHIFDMPDHEINAELDKLMVPLHAQSKPGITGQRLTTSPIPDHFWTFAAYTIEDETTHVLWVAFGAQNLTTDTVKEIAGKFAEEHQLNRQAPVTH